MIRFPVLEQFGKYQLVRKLGAGGMAEVFLARSDVARGLAKLLVIKKIQPDLAQSPHFLGMFVDEAKIALDLNHPSIVQVFDFGHVGQTFFLAMEFVEGVDLLRVLKDCSRVGKRIPYGLCAYIVQQVAKGLDYAHRKTDEYGEPLGIVHRDISPQNVLISWDGAVKIVDFGIARARNSEEEPGVIKGKFAYMSPEQAQALPVDNRSDIYSTGILLFELACGRPLFPGRGKEVLEVVKAGAIPAPTSCDPNLPPKLEEILLRTLAYHPDDRYQTARDLQNALGRFQVQYAQTEDDRFDSGTLAQFLAQFAPKTPSERTQVRSVKRSGSADPHADLGSGPYESSRPSREERPMTPKSVRDAPSSSPGWAGVSEIRERKHVLLLEGMLSGLDVLDRRVGPVRAQKTVAEFLSITEHIAYKHEARSHGSSGPSAPYGRFTYVIGLPVVGEDDSSRAIRLALALVDALDGIGRDVEPELRLSVGIQRGIAIVTRKGTSWSYELAGATTSIARQLAEKAPGGDIIVGGSVFQLARGDWNFEELPPISLDDDTCDTNPGVHEETDPLPRHLRVHRLRGPKEREQRMRFRRDGGDLIGRELELKALREAYRKALVERRSVYVFLLGDEGVGKRTLVSTFLKGVGQKEALVIRAAARAITSDTPYGVIADLARDYLGLAEGADTKEVVRRLTQATTSLATNNRESREIATLAQIFAALLGVKSPASGSANETHDAEKRMHHLRRAIRRMEQLLTENQGAIVVIEDVHWADSQSWELLAALATEPSSNPVFVVATSRNDERILKLAPAANVTTITMYELGPEERMQFVLSRFAEDELESGVRDLATRILAKTGGNAFFIREIMESLHERGILAESKNHKGKLTWVKRDLPIQVPTSAFALVAARLDRLPHLEKEVITRAAILGRAFSTQGVELLVGRTVDAELASLALRGVIDRAPALRSADPTEAQPPGSFVFRNELTLMAAYDLLPGSERALLHKHASLALGQGAGYRKGQDDAVIARHLERAGDATAAANHYFEAAKHALEARGNLEAFRHLTQALALLPKTAHEKRYLARSDREVILRGWARRPEQLREIHHLQREADALGDAGRIADARIRLAQFYVDVGKMPAAKTALVKALDAAQKTGDPLAETQVLRIEANMIRILGQSAEALALLDRAFALCGDERSSLLERAHILNIRGTTLWTMNRTREALEAYAEAIVIYRKLRAHFLESRALNNMGIVFAILGEYEEALVHMKRALRIDTELNDRQGIAIKLSNIGQQYCELGDLDKADKYLGKALLVAQQVKDRIVESNISVTLGQVALKHEDSARALGLFHRGLELARQAQDRYQEIRALVYVALAELKEGHPLADVLSKARTAVDMARAALNPVGEVFGLSVEALALAALGHPHEAAERSAEAVRVLDATHTSEGADEILHIHARLARAAGREGEARAALERAHGEIKSKAGRLRDVGLREQYLRSVPARDIIADFAKL